MARRTPRADALRALHGPAHPDIELPRLRLGPTTHPDGDLVAQALDRRTSIRRPDRAQVGPSAPWCTCGAISKAVVSTTPFARKLPPVICSRASADRRRRSPVPVALAGTSASGCTRIASLPPRRIPRTTSTAPRIGSRSHRTHFERIRTSPGARPWCSQTALCRHGRAAGRHRLQVAMPSTQSCGPQRNARHGASARGRALDRPVSLPRQTPLRKLTDIMHGIAETSGASHLGLMRGHRRQLGSIASAAWR